VPTTHLVTEGIAVPRRTYVFTKDDLTHRLSVPITDEMDRFLSDLVQRSKALTGRHFDKSQVARSLLRALMQRSDDLDLKGVKDENDLVLKVLRLFSKR
jgi:hypothetical protein